MQVDCEVDYIGRGKTHLGRGVRLLIRKDDGSVSIHRDKGVMPLNYMGASSFLEEYTDKNGLQHFVFSSKKESIDVGIYNILFETYLADFCEDDLARQGTENQLQAWLAEQINFEDVIGQDTIFLCREYETGKGSVDLLGYDKADDAIILVEVKRYGKRFDTFQLMRYREAMLDRCAYAESCGLNVVESISRREAPDLDLGSVRNLKMVLVAERFAKDTVSECEEFGIEYRKIKHSYWCKSR